MKPNPLLNVSLRPWYVKGGIEVRIPLTKGYVDMLERKLGRTWAAVPLALSSIAVSLFFLVLIYFFLSILIPPLRNIFQFSLDSTITQWIIPTLTLSFVVYLYLSGKSQASLIESISKKADDAIERAKSVEEKHQLEKAKKEFIQELTTATMDVRPRAM